MLKTNKPRKKGDPYNPIHVFGDKTKVSGDSPGWFGVDNVTVANKSQVMAVVQALSHAA